MGMVWYSVGTGASKEPAVGGRPTLHIYPAARAARDLQLHMDSKHWMLSYALAVLNLQGSILHALSAEVTSGGEVEGNIGDSNLHHPGERDGIHT